MSPSITIEPISRPFDAKISPPGSKSLTNRALVLATMAEAESVIRNALRADDTAVMIEALRRLGTDVAVDDADRTIRVRGGKVQERRGDSVALHCDNSGTTLRFLTALCSIGRRECVLDGGERMRQRPVGELVEMLRNFGARIEHLERNSFPPIRVKGSPAGGIGGGIAHARGGAASSQFLSAALMIAPLARNEVVVDLGRPQTSWPYVAMTMRLMDEFGALCELTRDPLTAEPTQINVPGAKYVGTEYTVEPDATAATYFLAAAAIHKGSRVTIEGLGSKSLQGDVRFAEVLKKMRANVKIAPHSITVEGTDELEPIDVNLADMPDTAQTLAVVALFADGESTIRGLRSLRVKETDRLEALKNELTKLGATVKIESDDSDAALLITPPKLGRPADIETYNDHRMAMSFAVAATKIRGVTIRDPACVSKTYPGFFDDLARVLADPGQ